MPTKGGAETPRAWESILPPPDAVDWCRARRPPFEPRVFLATAGFVDACVAAVLLVLAAPANFPAAAVRGWPVFLAGPILALGLWPLSSPYRVGVGPRGLLLQFPLRTLFVPWGLVSPLRPLGSGLFPLGYVDTRTMRTSTCLLRASEADWLRERVGSAAWPARTALDTTWGRGESVTADAPIGSH